MHTHHAEVELVGSREAAQPKQGARYGNLRPLGQRAHLAHRARLDDAVPGKNYGALRVEDELGCLSNALLDHTEHRMGADFSWRNSPLPLGGKKENGCARGRGCLE